MTDVDPDPIQAEILEDGQVTVAEMERALLAVVSCMEARGYVAELTHFEHGEWAFIADSDTSEDGEAASRTLRECESAMLSEIKQPYRDEHGLTDQEIEDERQQIRQCLADLGYEVEGTPFGELFNIADPWDYIECDPATLVTVPPR